MPEDVAGGVRAMMREFGLFFGALENWHWLVKNAGVPLVDAMADALQEGRA